MSEDKSRASHPIEDLSVLARRGALSTADERAFTSALSANPTLATAHQLGLDFDQVASVKPGDEALIAEVAARAVSRGRPAGFARFRLRGLLLAGTLAIASSAAAFWKLAQTRTNVGPVATPPLPTGAPATSAGASSEQPRASSEPPRASSEQPRASSKPPRASSEPPREALAKPESKPERAPGANAVNGSDVASSATDAPRAPGVRVDEPNARTFDSAESLFREANAARRSGDVAVARALYLRLEHDFPASDEAHLAHVSLGNLLLAMGRAREAEQQFASYLGGRPALAQEALVGRAQSLAALGRSAEEQRVWEGLLRDYPSSVYAGRAKQRLAELARSAARPE
jgi:TolA-binding protein